MTKRTKSVLFYALILVILLLSWWWLKLSPSVKPGDVELKAQFVHLDAATAPGKAEWAIDITLVNHTDHIIGRGNDGFLNDGYFSMVTPYIEGQQLLPIETSLNNSEAGQGSDFRITSLVTKTLQNMGIPLSSEQEISHSFHYAGLQKEFKARAYAATLDGSPVNLDNKKAFVFYSHYEKKWGRNLSWTKAVPVRKS